MLYLVLIVICGLIYFFLNFTFGDDSNDVIEYYDEFGIKITQEKYEERIEEVYENKLNEVDFIEEEVEDDDIEISYVYLMVNNENKIRVGVSPNPHKTLAYMKNSNKSIELLQSKKFKSVYNSCKYENMLHELFNEYHYAIDWVKLPENELKKLKSLIY